VSWLPFRSIKFSICISICISSSIVLISIQSHRYDEKHIICHNMSQHVTACHNMPQHVTNELSSMNKYLKSRW
jgi:hypothetical protein